MILGPFGRYIVQTLMTREDLSKAMASGGVLKAEDAFEFSSQLQMNQVPHPNNPSVMVQTIGKMNVAFRADASCFPLKMEFSTTGCMVYWLDDLNQSDALTYKDLIQQATRMADGWAAQRAEKSSGVALASSMPTGMPRPGVRG